MIHRARIIPFFLLLIFLAGCSWPLTAVAREKTIPASSPPTVVLKKTSTASPTQPVTATEVIPPPSQTPTRPVPPSATASFTPTTFAAPSATGTAPAGQCAKTTSDIAPTPEFVHPQEFLCPSCFQETEVVDYLNHYGAAALYEAYQKVDGQDWPGAIQAYRDLTNDGVPEIIFTTTGFYIFGCKADRYETLFFGGPDAAWLQPPGIVSVFDANRNGLPEIALLLGYMSQGGHFYQVFEWDGEQFQGLIVPADDASELSIFVEATGNLEYGDVDHNGMSEYIVLIGIPVWETYDLGVPWRNEKQIYQWNGTRFVFTNRIFSAPEYRFQAVQDGDRAMQAGDLESALNFYRLAIYKKSLKAWSLAQREFLMNIFRIHNDFTPTPIPPLPDPKEYAALAAYARYRIMLHHLARGWVSDARAVYDQLQKEHPRGTPGYIYASLAKAVGMAFSETNDLGKACDRALDFASQNKDEVFYYISGSGYPGNHGINYQDTPEMICPFP